MTSVRGGPRSQVCAVSVDGGWLLWVVYFVNLVLLNNGSGEPGGHMGPFADPEHSAVKIRFQ